MNRRWVGVGIGVVVAIGAACAIALQFFLAGSATAEFWEDEIEAFEQSDAESAPEPGAIVFTGSSSIRMWDSLAEDMAPYRVLNRGFGGSHLAHVDTYAERIVLPYQPRAIVLYAGDNDVGSGKTAETVARDFDRFVERVRAAGSDAPILFVAIKPSRLRFEQWPVMAAANAAIAERCAKDPLLHYADIAGPMLALAEDGEPPPGRLFLFDGLHLSADGYAIWTRVMRQALEQAVGPPPAG